jgi:hypothetical protein
MVFNLEVDGQHVYHVASNGLLAHNVCSWGNIGSHGPMDVCQALTGGEK